MVKFPTTTRNQTYFACLTTLLQNRAKYLLPHKPKKRRWSEWKESYARNPLLRDFFVREMERGGDHLRDGHKSASAENTLSQKENFPVWWTDWLTPTVGPGRGTLFIVIPSTRKSEHTVRDWARVLKLDRVWHCWCIRKLGISAKNFHHKLFNN